MSGVYIEMAMPRNCLQCPLQGGTADCRLTQKTYNWGLKDRPSDCPLIPVPDHGRLVDADDMQLEWYRLNFDGKISEGTLAYWNYRLSQIPTIIPADKDGDT